MKKILLILLLIGVYSCTENFTETEVLGIYTPIDYKNSYDTIQLKKNGVYHRTVYDINKRKILDLKGKYELQNNGSQIFFRSFFLNLDRDLVKFPELVKDTTGGGIFNLERFKGKVGFCTGYYSADLPNQNCYHKQ